MPNFIEDRLKKKEYLYLTVLWFQENRRYQKTLLQYNYTTCILRSTSSRLFMNMIADRWTIRTVTNFIIIFIVYPAGLAEI